MASTPTRCCWMRKKVDYCWEPGTTSTCLTPTIFPGPPGRYHAVECLKIKIEWLQPDINNRRTSRACCHWRLPHIFGYLPRTDQNYSKPLSDTHPITPLSSSDASCFFSITVPTSRNALSRVLFSEKSSPFSQRQPDTVRLPRSGSSCRRSRGCAHSYTAGTLPLRYIQTDGRTRTKAIWWSLWMWACVYAAELDGERLFDCYLVYFNSLALLLKCCRTVASPPSTKRVIPQRWFRGKKACLGMICWFPSVDTDPDVIVTHLSPDASPMAHWWFGMTWGSNIYANWVSLDP